MSIANVQTDRLLLETDREVAADEFRMMRGTHDVAATDHFPTDYIVGRQKVRRWVAISDFDAMPIDLLRREMRSYLFGDVVGREGAECQLLADQYIVDAVNAGYLRLVRKRQSRR